MMRIMSLQKYNLSQAVDKIKHRYPGLEKNEQLMLDKLVGQAWTVDHIDDFVLLGSQFALVTTFLHQKYFPDFPPGYQGVDFKAKVTCQQVFDLPYDKMIDHPDSFLSELSQLASETWEDDYVFRVHALSELLKRQRPLVLYPGFDELAEPFFLQCFPLGFFPLGLTAEPYVMADALPHSPAQFYFHDQAHAALVKRDCTMGLMKEGEEEGYREKNKVYLRLVNNILAALKPEDKELCDSLVRVLVCKNHEFAKPFWKIFERPDSARLADVFDNTQFNSMTSKKDMEAFLWLDGFVQYIRRQPSLEGVLATDPNTLVSEYGQDKPFTEDDVRRLYAWKKLSKSPQDFLLRVVPGQENFCPSLPKYEVIKHCLGVCYKYPEMLLKPLKKSLDSGVVSRASIPDEFFEYYHSSLSM